MAFNVGKSIGDVKYHGPLKVSIPLKPIEKGWIHLFFSVFKGNVRISIVLTPKRSLELRKTIFEADISAEKWREFAEATVNCIIRATQEQQSKPILWALSKLGAVKADLELIIMRLKEG
ncbi:MAG: hypothetical protein QW803_08395 [Candidatus Methanomethylicia archaeon]